MIFPKWVCTLLDSSINQVVAPEACHVLSWARLIKLAEIMPKMLEAERFIWNFGVMLGGWYRCLIGIHESLWLLNLPSEPRLNPLVPPSTCVSTRQGRYHPSLNITSSSSQSSQGVLNRTQTGGKLIASNCAPCARVCNKGPCWQMTVPGLNRIYMEQGGAWSHGCDSKMRRCSVMCLSLFTLPLIVDFRQEKRFLTVKLSEERKTVLVITISWPLRVCF